MGKVLISFLGTGNNGRNNQNDRDYRKANYKFEDGEIISKSFIALALKEHYNIDRVILIGTTHSMWEQVYDQVCPEEEKDNAYWEKLAEFCDNAHYDTPIEKFPETDTLERALGNNSRIILIKYGLNKEEILENQQKILSIEQMLEFGDELYVDITHSFRSLPLFLLNSLIYIQNVSEKKISIKHISYGMLDATGEFGNTPVVDLLDILDTSDWIMGAYAFKEFGQSYKIAELMHKLGDNDTPKRLTNFSQAMNLNVLDTIRNQTDILALRNREFQTEFSRMIVNPIVEDFSKSFLRVPEDKLYLFQFRLAQWHSRHFNYSSAYICLVESIISYVCHFFGLNEKKQEHRDQAKKIIWENSIPEGRDNEFLAKLKRLRWRYSEANRIRITIAHSTEDKKGHRVRNSKKKEKDSIDYFIRFLQETLKELEKEII